MFHVFVLVEVADGIGEGGAILVYFYEHFLHCARACAFVKLHITTQPDSDVLSFLYHTYECSQWRLPFQKPLRRRDKYLKKRRIHSL